MKNNIFTCFIILVCIAFSACGNINNTYSESVNTNATSTNSTKVINMPLSYLDCLYEPYTRIQHKLERLGYTNIVIEKTATDYKGHDGKVSDLTINGSRFFSKGSEFSIDSKVIVTYLSYIDTIPSDDWTKNIPYDTVVVRKYGTKGSIAYIIDSKSERCFCNNTGYNKRGRQKVTKQFSGKWKGNLNNEFQLYFSNEYSSYDITFRVGYGQNGTKEYHEIVNGEEKQTWNSGSVKKYFSYDYPNYTNYELPENSDDTDFGKVGIYCYKHEYTDLTYIIDIDNKLVYRFLDNNEENIIYKSSFSFGNLCDGIDVVFDDGISSVNQHIILNQSNSKMKPDIRIIEKDIAYNCFEGNNLVSVLRRIENKEIIDCDEITR